jgi:hypothetical protein
MKRTLLSVVFVYLWAAIAPAVAQKPANTLSFSGGYSLPLGKFASEQFNDPEAGLAAEGYYGEISYERRLVSSWLGMRLSGSLTFNQTIPQALVDQYSVVLRNPESYTWISDAIPWRIGSVMVGPVVYLNIKKVQLAIHGQAGGVFARSPSVSLLGTSTASGSDPVDASVQPSQVRNFGMGGGLSVRLPLSQRLFVQLSGQGVASQLEFKNVSTSVTYGSRPPLQSFQTAKRLVAVANLGTGLVLFF